jgi:hypothetical protein
MGDSPRDANRLYRTQAAEDEDEDHGSQREPRRRMVAHVTHETKILALNYVVTNIATQKLGGVVDRSIKCDLWCCVYAFNCGKLRTVHIMGIFSLIYKQRMAQLPTINIRKSMT